MKMKKIIVLFLLSLLAFSLGLTFLILYDQQFSLEQNIENETLVEEKPQDQFVEKTSISHSVSSSDPISSINLTAITQELDLIEEQLYLAPTEYEKKNLLVALQNIEIELEKVDVDAFSSRIATLYHLLYQDNSLPLDEQETGKDSIQEEIGQEQDENLDDSQALEYTEEEILVLLETLAEEYDVPSWFLKALVRRESSFNATEISHDDGIEGNDNWNNQRDCAFTEDGYPHGVGLTKLTGWMYQGKPYPFCLDAPNNDYEDWYYAMRMQDFGLWIDMNEVAILQDPFDPRQNVERFLTGYAIPAYTLFTSQYPDETEEEIWRRVAFHWNKGLYQEYDFNNEDYLALYDKYVEWYHV